MMFTPTLPSYDPTSHLLTPTPHESTLSKKLVVACVPQEPSWLGSYLQMTLITLEMPGGSGVEFEDSYH